MVLPRKQSERLGRPYALNPQENEPLAMSDWVDFVVLMVLPQNLFWLGQTLCWHSPACRFSASLAAMENETAKQRKLRRSAAYFAFSWLGMRRIMALATDCERLHKYSPSPILSYLILQIRPQSCQRDLHLPCMEW